MEETKKHLYTMARTPVQCVVFSGTYHCCVHPSVRLPPCWILGTTRGVDGGLELSQGMKEEWLWDDEQDHIRDSSPVSSDGHMCVCVCYHAGGTPG